METKITKLRNLLTPVVNYFSLKEKEKTGITCTIFAEKEYEQVIKNMPEILEILKQIPDNACENTADSKPEWLTEEIRFKAREIWYSHKTTDDGFRVKAVKYLRECSMAEGYTMTISKALDVLKKHCID